ncbi:MAG TPA: glycosyltransferase family A protein [Candidatus Limnocylindrales bacterium]|nr:glycosyltransferase family A protein [Candidatus Limnocylindrales bacterium]
MTAPLVSVVVPIYNSARYLGEAIESVLAQTYRPIEIIVVDDGSTDESARVAQWYPVRYYRQPHSGPGAARNRGIMEAHGEFLAFLDADDVWMPEKLEVQVGYLIEHPDVQYTTTRIEFFLEPGCPFPATLLRQEILEGDWSVRLIQTLVARRQVFNHVGIFDPQMSTAEDVDWFARANDLGTPMAVIDRVLLLKRIHDRNTSVNMAENMQNVFIALRRSVARKRELKKEG